MGSYLLRSLVRKGYNNILAIRRKDSRMDLVAPIQEKIQWKECDVLDVLGLEKVMEGVEQVYHAAATISFDPRNREKMYLVNVEGTSNIVNMALQTGVEKLVHVSSIAAIGRRKKLKTINEKTKWEKSKFNSHYGISKYLSEQEVWRGMAEGLNALIVNPSIILGAGFWEEGTASLFSKIWKGNKFYGRGGNGFVDVRDVARLMIEMMESGLSRQRFIANGENWTYQKVFESIADSMNKKRPNIPLNNFLGGLAWRVEALRSRFTGSQALVTRETVQNSFRTWFYENEKSRQSFDFTYTPIDQTISDTGKSFLTAINEKRNSSYFSLNQ